MIEEDVISQTLSYGTFEGDKADFDSRKSADSPLVPVKLETEFSSEAARISRVACADFLTNVQPSRSILRPAALSVGVPVAQPSVVYSVSEATKTKGLNSAEPIRLRSPEYSVKQQLPTSTNNVFNKSLSLPSAILPSLSPPRSSYRTKCESAVQSSVAFLTPHEARLGVTLEQLHKRKCDKDSAKRVSSPASTALASGIPSTGTTITGTIKRRRTERSWTECRRLAIADPTDADQVERLYKATPEYQARRWFRRDCHSRENGSHVQTFRCGEHHHCDALLRVTIWTFSKEITVETAGSHQSRDSLYTPAAGHAPAVAKSWTKKENGEMKKPNSDCSSNSEGCADEAGVRGSPPRGKRQASQQQASQYQSLQASQSARRSNAAVKPSTAKRGSPKGVSDTRGMSVSRPVRTCSQSTQSPCCFASPFIKAEGSFPIHTVDSYVQPASVKASGLKCQCMDCVDKIFSLGLISESECCLLHGMIALASQDMLGGLIACCNTTSIENISFRLHGLLEAHKQHMATTAHEKFTPVPQIDFSVGRCGRAHPSVGGISRDKQQCRDPMYVAGVSFTPSSSYSLTRKAKPLPCESAKGACLPEEMARMAITEKAL